MLRNARDKTIESATIFSSFNFFKRTRCHCRPLTKSLLQSYLVIFNLSLVHFVYQQKNTFKELRSGSRSKKSKKGKGSYIKAKQHFRVSQNVLEMIDCFHFFFSFQCPGGVIFSTKLSVEFILID